MNTIPCWIISMNPEAPLAAALASQLAAAGITYQFVPAVDGRQGMPVLQGRGRGDLVMEIMVETPTKLTPRQKELLRELQETETGEECPESKGFFDKLKEAWNDLTE